MNISWYFNRLRAMSVREVLWRLEQKKLEKAERRTFGKQHIRLTDGAFYQGKEDLRFHVEKLPIADRAVDGGADAIIAQNKEKITCNRCISLLGGYAYEKYRKDWHAGFQTENKWTLDFSYDLKYKQRDEIGDARTNWELNRHFQFALLACSYYHSGEERFLTELSELFADWNQKNPFLHGISWTSVMEIAIRDINWIYTLGFLKKTLEDLDGQHFDHADQNELMHRKKQLNVFCEQLRIGIINMTTYISAHYSRYSSANNHVIVEAATMGIAGIVMECEEWLDMAVDILNAEIPRQNYKDGVNKEVSLHYQSFFMEAVGLLVLAMQQNQRNVPMNWRYMLQKMSRYMADCQGKYGETIVFGDDDEGKILDLEGVPCRGRENENELPHRNHYLYVLQLMSLILPERYTDKVTDVSLLRIVSTEKIEATAQKPCYVTRGNICYEDGGVSIFKSSDGRALIGIDHGELGFGSIAAHGHADALSFQMYLDGKPVFADAGTYIYHTDLESRNAFRKTENHNTVTVNGKDQSEMLGAFLWGKRAKTTLLWHNLAVGGAGSEKGMEKYTGAAVKCPDAETENAMENAGVYYVEAEQDGYAPVIHRRKFVFDERTLQIYDSLLNVQKEISYEISFLLGSDMLVDADKECLSDIMRMIMPNNMDITIRMQCVKKDCSQKERMPIQEILPTWISEKYGRKRQVQRICFKGNTEQDVVLETMIMWENRKNEK